MLLSHPWPGNLRQLNNVIASAIALVGNGRLIEPRHLPEDFLEQAKRSDAHLSPARVGSPGLCTLDEAEQELIERAVGACQGNMSTAARVLGISRSTLYNKRQRGKTR
jgi:transcriptional regulator of acetoin/glycerol metabolism